MPHRDLAGLVMESDAVVVAERVSVEHPARYSEIGHYRVERALFGTMAKGMEVAVEQSLYATGRHNLDKRAVLFLVKGELVPSGMRVIEGGKVFRFEQFDNPGGWGMVPQGHDPQDNWQAGVAAVDLPTFEREVSDAVARGWPWPTGSRLSRPHPDCAPHVPPLKRSWWHDVSAAGGIRFGAIGAAFPVRPGHLPCSGRWPTPTTWTTRASPASTACWR